MLAFHLKMWGSKLGLLQLYLLFDSFSLLSDKLHILIQIHSINIYIF